MTTLATAHSAAITRALRQHAHRWVRSSATASSSTPVSSPVAQPDRSTKPAAGKKKRTWTDSEFVQRRNAYEERIKAMRTELHRREVEKKGEEMKKQREQEAELLKIRQARSARRREKSMVKVAIHRAKVAHAMEEAKKRSEHGFSMWKAERERVDALKMGAINRLNDNAQHWLTDETIAEEVEKIVDEFFIASTKRTDIDRILSQ